MNYKILTLIVSSALVSQSSFAEELMAHTTARGKDTYICKGNSAGQYTNDLYQSKDIDPRGQKFRMVLNETIKADNVKVLSRATQLKILEEDNSSVIPSGNYWLGGQPQGLKSAMFLDNKDFRHEDSYIQTKTGTRWINLNFDRKTLTYSVRIGLRAFGQPHYTCELENSRSHSYYSSTARD